MSLPSDPFAFKSGALESSLPQTKVQISHLGSTGLSSTSSTSNSFPSAASMFQSFANQNTQSEIPTNNNNTAPISFTVDTTNIDQSVAQFRSTEDENPPSFDVFKTAQEQIDQNSFESAFISLDFNAQRKELDQLKKQHLQDQLANPDQTTNSDMDWLLMLNAIEEEVAKVEQAVQIQEEIEVQNAIAMIGHAIQHKTTISLPSQSAESKALTEHVTKLYAEFAQKQKTKEYQKQMNLAQQSNNSNSFTSTSNQRPKQGSKGTSAKDQLSKNKKAANRALDRFNQLDELVQDQNLHQRRQGGGHIDFLNDESGPYKKQSQAKKKKGKKLGW
jgi:hypothetical protein